MTARGDRTRDDPLTLLKALDVGPEPLDDPHRLMSNGQTLRDRILALQDMNVGAADRGRAHPHQCVQRAHLRNALLLKADTAGFDEHGGFHFGHGFLSRLAARVRPTSFAWAGS